MYRGVAMRIPSVNPPSCLNQSLHDLAMPISAREMKHRVPSNSNSVVPRPVPQQKLNAVLSAVHLQQETERGSDFG